MSTNRPVDHVRLGAIDAAIWQNEGSKGRPIYNVTLQRSYRDPETGEWGNTASFGRDDLLTLAKVADGAHTRICELQTLDRIAREKREQGDGSVAAEPAAQESSNEAIESDGVATVLKARTRAKAAGASR